MKEIGSYYLYSELGAQAGIRLIFHINCNELRDWFLPNITSIELNRKLIAIEHHYYDNGIEVNKFLCDLKIGDIADLKTGELYINYKSNNKYMGLIRLDNISLKFVMIVPSWGRWTKKRLWLIISNKG